MTMNEEQIFRAIGDGRRIDTLLAAETGLSRSRAAALIAEGRCAVDGVIQTRASFIAKPGAAILLTVPPPKPAAPQPEDIPLDILYQDADLAVVMKPCGMVVHPAPGNESGTMVNALLTALDSLSGIGGETRPGIVHRLDKDTSGLLLVAKNDTAQQALSLQLQERGMEKHYLALAEGFFREEEGRVDRPIARSKTDRKKMAVDQAGRDALTLWRVLERGSGATLLDVHIVTGRTHQIRVHLKSIGHPVCGDPIYGTGRGLRVPRLMLHARSLTFTHPSNGARMTFHASIPEDFLRGLDIAGIPRKDWLGGGEATSSE